MVNIVDLNLKVAIAFALVMIVGLLTYIAFFKEPVKKILPLAAPVSRFAYL